MEKQPVATIKFKNFGTLKVELYLDTPNSTNNFIALAKSGFYDGLTIHRIQKNFVLQGGCPLGTGTGGPGYTIDGEFPSNGFENPHTHTKGTIAWARSMARNSAGSQFYITLTDTPFLDEDYAIFGQTIEGLELLEKFNEIGTNNGTPTETVIIETIEIETFGQEFPEPIKISKNA
ncbi:MAG: peptidylprolyl isomerase [Mycoplasmatales bacterium]